MPKTHEQTINIALGEVLQGLGQDWSIRAEKVGKIFEDGGRPDVLVEKTGGWPIIVEAEVGKYRQAEEEAKARLGKRLIASTRPIDTTVALVYPEELRNRSDQALRDAIRDVDLEYAIFSTGSDGNTKRLPSEGWLSGGVTELALLLHRSSIPAWRVETLADALELGVNRAEGDFSTAHPANSTIGDGVASALGQSDDGEGQTRRMAMTVIVNAFVFHEALAEAEMLVLDQPSGVPRPVRSPRDSRTHEAFRPTHLLDEWEKILAVNYWPIFHTAGAILRELPTQAAASMLETLWETAEELVAGGVTRSHDLTGVVFQRLIADRKFLATFYTRPAAASLLAGLAMPLHSPLGGNNWGNADTLSTARIGDFACGTGTLLSTAYQRLGLLHEVHEGNPKELHPVMMENGLVGLDVLNVAVHLTAAMLAGTHPDTPFEGECLLTMPYGKHSWGTCLGSLDLLEGDAYEIVQEAARTAGGRGEEEVRDLLNRVEHEQFDLVIMNPPFTRHGAREGDRTLVHNPAFAAFKASEEEQNELASRLRDLAAGGCAHGHAGLASYFVELAHRKVAPSGTLALVLPLSAMSGASWERVRNLWRDQYSSLSVTTISEKSTHSRSFSADTGMAECLVPARKLSPETEERRGTFAVLESQPQTTHEGELIAQAISTAIASGQVRKLEDGPFGGSRISLGATHVGEIVNCPLPSEGAWQMVGISDISLGQTAYQLSNGRLWIEGMPVGSASDVPVVPIGGVCSRIGPHHLDVTGAAIKADGLPQGPFEKIRGTPPGTAYPCLWNHDARRERRMTVLPDSHCRIREVSGGVPRSLRQRADARWKTATRAHYNLDF